MTQSPLDVHAEIATLVDGWCERRALRPLRIILGCWPMPNGFTDEWQQLWAALRHLRSMCREELERSGEFDQVNALIAELSSQLFPCESEESLDTIADRLLSSIFQSPKE